MAKKDTSLKGRVKRFFGMDDSPGLAGETIFRNIDAIDNIKSLGLSDPLLAAIIQAYGQVGQSENARSAFYNGSVHLDDLAVAQSANNTLEVLLDIDIDQCMSFLDEMHVNFANPSTFILIAKHNAQYGIWPKIGEIYNRAKRAGAVSEELALLTMQAVCESELLNGKILVLRKIVDDISHVVGMRSNDWIPAKYWGIKRYVGFHYARVSSLFLWFSHSDTKHSKAWQAILSILSNLNFCCSSNSYS